MKHIILILIHIIILTSCSKKNDNKEKIQKLLIKAKYYDQNKKYQQALQKFQLLKEYETTKEYEELDIKTQLEKMGWSIEHLKSSLTIKVMTDLQNEINEYITTNGKFPNFTMHPFVQYDAWGRIIKFSKEIEDKHKKFFDYYLYSKGPDLKTEGDDIAIYNKSLNKITNEKKKMIKQTKGDSEKLLDLEAMIKAKKQKE